MKNRLTMWNRYMERRLVASMQADAVSALLVLCCLCFLGGYMLSKFQSDVLSACIFGGSLLLMALNVLRLQRQVNRDKKKMSQFQRVIMEEFRKQN